MAVEGGGFAVYDEGRVTLGDHAVLMTLDRADALIALPGNGTVHDFARVGAGDDLAAMTRRVADSNDSFHFTPINGCPGFHAAAIAFARMTSRFERSNSIWSAALTAASSMCSSWPAYRIAI